MDVRDFVGDSEGVSAPVPCIPSCVIRRRRASMRTASRSCRNAMITASCSTVLSESRLNAIAAIGSSCVLLRRCFFCISTTCWYRLYVALQHREISLDSCSYVSVQITDCRVFESASEANVVQIWIHALNQQNAIHSMHIYEYVKSYSECAIIVWCKLLSFVHFN